jgi:hypothetical protein
MPSKNDLYKIVNNIRKSYDISSEFKYSWETYLEEGIQSLYNEELDCRRPVEDKLYFSIGEKNIIEANHPEDPLKKSDRRKFEQPTLRFGKIGGIFEKI